MINLARNEEVIEATSGSQAQGLAVQHRERSRNHNGPGRHSLELTSAIYFLAAGLFARMDRDHEELRDGRTGAERREDTEAGR